jgi:hypothetical protein
MVYAGFRFTGGYGLLRDNTEKFILNDIYSLVVVPTEQGDCKAAVGYREKHVIGTFIAEPIKSLVCESYYFSDRPEASFPQATVVLVRLQNGEYHWILETQLAVRL